MLDLKETINQLAMANCVRWYGHALRRELDFEVEGQRKKGRQKRMWKEQVGEESKKVSLRKNYALCRSLWSVRQDCCCVEVNLATLTYWGYYKILNICVNLSFVCKKFHLLIMKIF